MSDPSPLWRDQLLQGSQAMGLALEEPQLQQLLAYLHLLSRWNQVYNLTAVRDPQEMVPRHLLDSLSILPWVSDGRLLDLGTGAGLPGIPLAILCPGLEAVLLDSNGKKTRFVQQAVLSLGLQNVSVVHSRIEDYPGSQGFDMITARAFSSLVELVKLSGRWLVEDGVWLAMKGLVPNDEIAQLEGEGVACEVFPLQVPQLVGERHLIRMLRPRTSSEVPL